MQLGTAWRRSVAGCALFVWACTRTPTTSEGPDDAAAEPTTAPGESPPPAPEPGPVGPIMRFTAPEGPRVCRYGLEEVRTETLGDRATGGHQIKARLNAVVAPATDRKKASVTVRLTVEHVTADAKNSGYRLKLDSRRAPDQLRVAGGAETLVFFDVIAYFALVDRPVTASLAPTGALAGPLAGAEDARERFMKLHPPRPRTNPRQRALVDLSLSDRSILERLWPHTPEVPKRGIATEAVLPPGATSRTYDDFWAVGQVTRRLSRATDKHLLEVRTALAPPEDMPNLDIERGPTVPSRSGPPERRLLGIERSVLMELAPPDPCIVRAASQEKMRVAYTGEFGEQEGTTEQVIHTVRTLTRLP